MADAASPDEAAARVDWQRLSAWLDEALDLDDPAARAAWRAGLRAPPEALAELDVLLAAHEQPGALQAPPALGLRAAPASGPRAGQLVGPWALQARLGQGGMAEVWRAHRADGAYEREVALKLPRQLPWRDDLGERLGRERDILARLNHPHIARLYDAGIDGQHPWLAMELVEGQPITEWCDARRLSPRERVRLLLQVLDAVTHAHAQLVLHRDLKPSNILVDAQGQAKLLDFGIAKLLAEGEALTRDTRLTELGGRALTPDYASPEQLRGEPLSAASDVYALGVLLHELLCGELPYRLRHRSAAQMETAILEDLPTRPSSRPAVAHAAQRGLTPRRLARLLRGDLDAITLTALRKEPAQRYASAADLRADLQRWLDDEPVRAQPDAWFYRSRVFIRRHRVGVAMGTLVAGALLASTVFSWQQARIAQREALRAEATRDFLLGLYKPVSWLDANPTHGGRVTARELLDLSAEQLRHQPVADPEVHQDLLATLVELYGDADDTQGQLASARQLLAHARAHFGPRSPELFEALVRLSLAEHAFARDDALKTLRQADAMAEARAAARPDIQARYWLSRGNLHEGTATPLAEAAFLQAIELTRDRPELTLYASRGLIGLARIRHLDQSRLDDAAALYTEALAKLRQVRELPVYVLTKPEVELAELLGRLGRFDEAESLLRPAYERSVQGLGPTYRDTVQTGLRLARLWRNTGRSPQALQLLTSLVTAHESSPALRADLATLPALRRELAELLSLLGQWPDAEQQIQQALAGLRQREAGKASALEVQWQMQRVQIEANLGRLDAAERVWQDAQAMARSVQPTPRLGRDLALTRAVRAALGAAPGPAEAGPLLDDWQTREEHELREARPEARARFLSRVWLWRAQAWLFARRPGDAELASLKALELLDEAGPAARQGSERPEAQALQAEAAALAGDAGRACALAGDAAAPLQERLPGSPLQRLSAGMLAWCADPAGASRTLPSPWPEPSPWTQRWRHLRAAPWQAGGGAINK